MYLLKSHCKHRDKNLAITQMIGKWDGQGLEMLKEPNLLWRRRNLMGSTVRYSNVPGGTHFISNFHTVNEMLNLNPDFVEPPDDLFGAPIGGLQYYNLRAHTI